MTTRPSYDEIAEAIQACLDSGLYELSLTQDGQPVEEPVWRLAKALEKAGLIDARGVWSSSVGAPPNRRIRCPGGCGKVVAIMFASGRISCHNDAATGKLCRAAEQKPAEVKT